LSSPRSIPIGLALGGLIALVGATFLGAYFFFASSNGSTQESLMNVQVGTALRSVESESGGLAEYQNWINSATDGSFIAYLRRDGSRLTISFSRHLEANTLHVGAVRDRNSYLDFVGFVPSSQIPDMIHRYYSGCALEDLGLHPHLPDYAPPG
jgi:hypothetical protein